MLTGVLPKFGNTSCDNISMISYGQDVNFLNDEDVQIAYSNIVSLGVSQTNTFGLNMEDHIQVAHDFNWNNFSGSLPLFSLGNDFFLRNGGNTSYKLSLENNMFNGSLPNELFSGCNDVQSFSVKVSANQISGALNPNFLINCLQLVDFEAADNHIGGPIPPEIGSLKMLQRLDLSNNMLSGSVPDEVGKLSDIEWFSLRENNLTGDITDQIGRLSSLTYLDLSHNALTGSIPGSLANDTNLQVVLLDHNRLSGETPASFSNILDLIALNVSFNNLSGHIPYLRYADNCDRL